MLRDRHLSGKGLFLVFLIIWLSLNVLQAAFTQLDPDETYYWMYARQLDWGYFDHPPGVAFLIKLGSSLFPNELGVRLGVILLQIGSFYGFWLLLGKPKEYAQVLTLIILLAAMPMLQIFGFVATPDAPLLFCGVWFFYFYQKFLEKESWANSVLLGICMAALLYSKYHGILLVFFTLFSNLSLLLRPKFYIAAVFGALLFFPHLYWQYAHEFPSVRYHLVEREDPFEWKHPITYVLNQFVIFNPFIFPMALFALLRQTNKGKMYRAYLVLIFCCWAFFLYFSFKGHAEPQWTALLTIPFVVLTWQYAVADAHFVFNAWIRRLGLLSIALFFVARLALLQWNIFGLTTNFHRTTWVFELQKVAKGLPVVFQNSYRDPSVYTFYTKAQAYTFTDAYYRKNQFDIWDWEKNLQNQGVLLAGQKKWTCSDCEQVHFAKKDFTLKWVDSLQVASKVWMSYRSNFVWQPGALVEIPLEIRNPYPHAIELSQGNMPLSFKALFYKEEEIAYTARLRFSTPLTRLPAHQVIRTTATFSIPEGLQGWYYFALGIQTGDLPPAFNSKLTKVTINH